MYFISYKSYPCAPKATLLSAACSVGELIALILAAFFAGMFNKAGSSMYHSPLVIVGAVLLLALAVVCHVFVYRKLVPAMAEKETEKNIRTKANFAKIYCDRNPEAYDELHEINADFAAHYTRDESGKIVKIKK